MLDRPRGPRRRAAGRAGLSRGTRCVRSGAAGPRARQSGARRRRGGPRRGAGRGTGGAARCADGRGRRPGRSLRGPRPGGAPHARPVGRARGGPGASRRVARAELPGPRGLRRGRPETPLASDPVARARPRRGDAVDGGRRVLRDRAPRRGAARILPARRRLHGGRGGDADGGGRHQGDVAGSPDPTDRCSRAPHGARHRRADRSSASSSSLSRCGRSPLSRSCLPLAARQHVAGDGGRDGAAVPPGPLRSRPRVRARDRSRRSCRTCSRSSPTSRSRSRSSSVAVAG